MLAGADQGLCVLEIAIDGLDGGADAVFLQGGRLSALEEMILLETRGIERWDV